LEGHLLWVAFLLMMRLGEAACGTYQHNRWPHGPGLCMYIAALNGIAGRGLARSVAVGQPLFSGISQQLSDLSAALGQGKL